MTLQEAIRSRKPFIRKSYPEKDAWIIARYDKNFEDADDDDHGECFEITLINGKKYDFIFEPQDILATDWLIKQKPAEKILNEVLKSYEQGYLMEWDELHSKIRKAKEILEKESKNEED